MLSLSVTAFAENITVTGDTTANVTASYSESTDSNPVYKVDIEWGSMAFTYTAASKGTWSVTSHIYEGAKDAAWSWAEGANQIKVTNHSNAGVTVTPTFAFSRDKDLGTAWVTFDKVALGLTTADNKKGADGAGQATTGIITVTPIGDLPEDVSGTIGTITLSVTPLTSGWKYEDGNMCYYGTDSVKVTGEQTIDGYACQFDEDGRLTLIEASGVITLDGNLYFVDSMGCLGKGWHYVTVDGNRVWYYGKEDYTLARNEKLTIDGVEYTFDGNGRSNYVKNDDDIPPVIDPGDGEGIF